MKTNHNIIDIKDEFIGTDVKNPKGENIGKVKSVKLNKHTGEVAYVVLSFGGWFHTELGDKVFAMPWEIFSYNEDKECFVINVDKEKLKESPGYDEKNPPDMSNPQWEKSLHSYYGVQSHRERHH
jgi:sporulation protein YlmC with PRC-barrel domain